MEGRILKTRAGTMELGARGRGEDEETVEETDEEEGRGEGVTVDSEVD